MSMNLHCAEVDLWQTPTYITYMCYSNNDGGWKGIKYRYIQWIKGQRSQFKNKEECNEWFATVSAHIKELDSYNKLTFNIV